jgi:rhamnosyltransferase
MPTLPPNSISIVIPVLNAGAFLPDLLPALLRQAPTPPVEILLVDSNSSDNTVALAAQHKNTRVIPAGVFSHGGARNLGVEQTQGDLVVFLTQDALPANDAWLHELIAPFKAPLVAATFSRQIPRADASPMESFFLKTHFPQMGKRYGFAPPPCGAEQAGPSSLSFQKDVFFSNVGSAVRRDVIRKYPFDPHLIMSEDQQFARDIIMAGFTVAYAPASVVIHSHNYTCLQAFRRYFDSVYSLTQIFPRHDLKSSVGMGTKYLRQEALMMLHHPRWLFHYAGYVFAKTMGTILGHFADKLPVSILKRVSMHSYFWTHP